VSPEELGARLERVEAALAHLERGHDDLDAVVVEQGREIARLRKRLEELGDTVRAQDAGGQPAPDRKPPHYAP
jgi:SlyX protein